MLPLESLSDSAYGVEIVFHGPGCWEWTATGELGSKTGVEAFRDKAQLAGQLALSWLTPEED